jgi:methyl-accepting chemotaxis protein
MKVPNKVKLGTKLISGFLVVAGLAMLMAVGGYMNMNAMQKNQNELYQGHLLPIKQLEAANAAGEKIRGDLHRFILLPNQLSKMEQSIAEQSEIVNKQMAECRARLLTEAEKNELLKFDASWAAYRQAVADDLKQVKASKPKAAIESVSPGGATLTARNAVEQSLRKLIQIRTGEADKMNSEIDSTGTRSRLIFAVGSVFVVVLGFVIGMILTRSITRPLNRVIDGLTDSANQVTTASGQVSSASQSLAEGASEQAAGIEETSSSMEEMSSMTKKNAENASQANTMMADTSRVVEEANQAMRELTNSMNEISVASEETGKIIKTIDEIAFQTNLLALNAAVEAARAGEAGAGFAVVADEVRNLAMRAAEAAKSTANLIEGTVKKIKNGSEIVSRTNEAFSKVATGAKKVGELVGEIAAASQEQSQGIEQINKAVVEMDKVVQKNAASAEESAAASEEMNAQAEQMKAFVRELVAVVGTRGNGDGVVSAKGSRHSEVSRGEMEALNHPSKVGIRKVLPAPAKKEKEMKGVFHKAKEVRPEQVIPMGEAEFKEF